MLRLSFLVSLALHGALLLGISLLLCVFSLPGGQSADIHESAARQPRQNITRENPFHQKKPDKREHISTAVLRKTVHAIIYFQTPQPETITPVPTPTSTLTPTPTVTPIPTTTPTPRPTVPPTPTQTPRPTATPTPTPTITPRPTFTPEPTATPTPTAPRPAATPTPTTTPIPTVRLTITPSPTVGPINRPEPTKIPSPALMATPPDSVVDQPAGSDVNSDVSHTQNRSGGGETARPQQKHSPGKQAGSHREQEDTRHDTQDTEKEVLNSYLRQLVHRINKAKRYPRRARRQGWEGTVVMKLRILSSGEIRHLTLHQQSAYPVLDKAALAAIQSIRRFPKFPRGLSVDSLTLTIPITFKLSTK